MRNLWKRIVAMGCVASLAISCPVINLRAENVLDSSVASESTVDEREIYTDRLDESERDSSIDETVMGTEDESIYPNDITDSESMESLDDLYLDSEKVLGDFENNEIANDDSDVVMDSIDISEEQDSMDENVGGSLVIEERTESGTVKKTTSYPKTDLSKSDAEVNLGELPFNRVSVESEVVDIDVLDERTFNDLGNVAEYDPKGIPLFIGPTKGDGSLLNEGTECTITVTGPKVTKKIRDKAYDEERFMNSLGVKSLYHKYADHYNFGSLIMNDRLSERLGSGYEVSDSWLMFLQWDLERKYGDNIGEIRKYKTATEFINKTHFNCNDKKVAINLGTLEDQEDVISHVKKEVEKEKAAGYYVAPVLKASVGLSFSGNKSYSKAAINAAKKADYEVESKDGKYIVHNKGYGEDWEDAIKYPLGIEQLAVVSSKEIAEKIGLKEGQYNAYVIKRTCNGYYLYYPFTGTQMMQAWAAEMDSWGTSDKGHWDFLLYGDEHFDYREGTYDRNIANLRDPGLYCSNYGTDNHIVHRQMLHHYATYDYTIKEPGTYTITVKGVNNYKGTKSTTLIVTKASKTDISAAKVQTKRECYPCTGKERKPVPTVTLGSKTLEIGKDCTISYENNKNPGTATIIVTGTGYYTGVAKGYFQLYKSDGDAYKPGKSITSAIVTTKQLLYHYTGKPRKPVPTVKLYGKTLEANKDYTVRYLDNKNVGSAKIIITGIGEYAGEITQYFSIYDPDEKQIPVYRLFNTKTGEHFYTSSSAERERYLKQNSWNSEGIAWYAPWYSSEPIYRLANPNNGDEHHYTKSESESSWLQSLGWKFEGIAWYSDPYKRVPIYRHYHPKQRTGNHHYTTSKGESNHIVKYEGWKYEGISFYVSKAGG